jgi:small-conductance mechanosensitive channel
MAFPDVRTKVRLNIGVAYDSNVQTVKKLLVDIALSVTGVEKDPLPEVFFASFGDSSLNMSLFFWVVDYNQIIQATDAINSLIVSRFPESGIHIPYPIKTVLLEKEA